MADLVNAMQQDTGLTLASPESGRRRQPDHFLMQFQSDIIHCKSAPPGDPGDHRHQVRWSPRVAERQMITPTSSHPTDPALFSLNPTVDPMIYWRYQLSPSR